MKHCKGASCIDHKRRERLYLAGNLTENGLEFKIARYRATLAEADQEI
jgi:hypothetical protein